MFRKVSTTVDTATGPVVFESYHDMIVVKRGDVELFSFFGDLSGVQPIIDSILTIHYSLNRDNELATIIKAKEAERLARELKKTGSKEVNNG